MLLFIRLIRAQEPNSAILILPITANPAIQGMIGPTYFIAKAQLIVLKHKSVTGLWLSIKPEIKKNSK